MNLLYFLFLYINPICCTPLSFLSRRVSVLVIHQEIFNIPPLECYHLFTHIACVQKLRGLWKKLNALRVQTGPSPSKYENFRRKLICYKGISFFKRISTLG